MFLPKELPKVRYKTVVEDVSFYDTSKTKYSKNLLMRSGKLVPTPDFSAICTQTGVYGAAEGVDCTWVCTQNGVYLVGQNGETSKSSLVFTKPVMLAVPRMNSLFVSDEELGTYSISVGASKIADLHFTSLAFHNERIFGTDGTFLFFTDLASYGSFDNFVQLPQKVTALCEYKGELLAFGKDILKIEIEPELTESSVQAITNGMAHVQPKTLALAGSKIFFGGNDGLFCLVGRRQRRLLGTFQLDFSQSQGTVVGNNYYVSAKLFGEGVILQIDCNTEKLVCVHSVDTSVVAGYSRVMFVYRKNLCTFGDGSAERGHFKSKTLTFGEEFARKQLRKLQIATKTNVVVHLVTEHDRRIYHIQGANVLQTVHIRGSCEKLTLEIYTEGDAEISQLAVTAEVQYV